MSNASRIRIRIRIRRFATLIAAASIAACHRDVATTAVGTLEITPIDLAPMVPARVVRVNVQEGQAVRPGDTVAVLTQAGLGDQVSEARARVASAQAQVDELVRGARPEEIA